MKENLTFSELAHFDGDGIGLYSKFYGKNCTIEARLVDIWRPGTGREKINEWAYKFHHHGGCPVVISSLTFTPKMMVKNYKNGSRKIIGGREGKLILEAAQRLNFSIVLTYPSIDDRMRFSLKSAILVDIIFERADIGIGSLLRTNYFSGLTEFSVPYDDECVTWGVPRIMSWSNDVVFVEFSGLVWIAVTLMFIVICLMGNVDRKFTLTKAGDKKIYGIISVTCDVFALHLGNPVLWITSSPSGRVLLIVCLCYSTVITTAYKTSLASILATDKGTSAIVDAQGILMENLSVGGSLYEWNILRDQVNESELTAELFERFVVDNDDVATRDRLKFDHDYAFLASRSWLSYERQKMVRNNEAVTFDVFDTCVLAYHTVVSFPKKSLLRKPMDRIIQRLTESGIFNHWDLENEIDANSVSANANDQENQNHGAAYKFQNIFVVYLTCITLSLFVFISELLVAKLQSKKGQDVIIQYF
ncbi:uncharacterized protein LOC125500695 [Athalia rosae]|uniref:uncharacterized protein LOC125500695 n=1 Tax=Athalia rosae TaxID=37344 RepID=UPI002033FE76|nr:uncharacterized protein LOC125500695 [Athalia rosae]